MERIYTNTTGFKKALKTITDIVTVAEMREYNLKIQFEYSLGIATMLTKHPVDDIIIQAQFDVDDATDESMLYTIELGELSEKLKKYRRKEPMIISLDGETVIFSTEDEDIYNTNVVDFKLEKRDFLKGTNAEINRKDIVNALNMSRSINRTTFHESSMVVKLAYTGKELHLYATNFAQIAISTLSTSTNSREKGIFDINLPTSLLTKVRNTIERGSGDSVTIGKEGLWVTIKTDDTIVQYQDIEDLKYVNFQDILSKMKWDKEVYKFTTDTNKKIVDTIYKKLRSAEDEKDDALTERYNKVYISFNKDALTFTEEEGDKYLFTRDLNSIMNRLPKNIEVAHSEGAILLKGGSGDNRLMLLAPYGRI